MRTGPTFYVAPYKPFPVEDITKRQQNNPPAVSPTATSVDTLYVSQPPSNTDIIVSIPPEFAPSQNTISNTPTGSSSYKDGVYTGNNADAFYGLVQVRAMIQGGKVTNVDFLDYPHDTGVSAYINSYATPTLRNEAIQAQSANVNVVSGATLTSAAFKESLISAFNMAKH